MKAPKYVIYTDHFAAHNNADKYIELEATNLLEALATVTSEYADETIYLVRVYEVVKGTRNKEYKRVCNVRTHVNNRIETVEQGLNPDTITRNTCDNYVWFE